MLSASPTKPARSKRLRSIETTINEPGESGYLDVVFSDAYPIARGRRREVVGTTSVIRLQRPFAIIGDFPKKIA